MIQKNTVIITSAGRTGTAFFAKLISENFRNAVCVHEPENINLKNSTEMVRNIKNFGFMNSVLKKLIGKWGITYISNKRMASEISKSEAANELIKQRKKFIESFEESLYVESSYHYYGLLDVLPLAFRNYKTIYIIRDPRDWVRSHINKREWYYKRNPHTLLRNRISPFIVNDEKYINIWRKMSRFEKLCWSWNYINSYAIKSASDNPDAKIYLFEEIFSSKNKKRNLYELVNFITSFKDTEIASSINLDKALRAKINKPNSYCFSHWTEWKKEKIKSMHHICGSLMERFNYGNEKEWKKFIN